MHRISLFSGWIQRGKTAGDYACAPKTNQKAELNPLDHLTRQFLLPLSMVPHCLSSALPSDLPCQHH